jgi:Uma2 family endonuclease
LTDVGDDRAWRIAYDKGVLEIRMPYQEQEVHIIILAYFVNAIADELEIEAMQVGALLLEKEELQRAIEPDTCFYTQHQALVISKVAESESFIVITGISTYRTFLFDC